MSMRPRNVPPSYRQPQPTSQFHVSDYLRILHKRRWTAGLVFLVVFAWGAYSTLKKTPIYQATSSVQIQNTSTRNAATVNGVVDQSPSYYDSDDMETEIRILQGRALAWRTIQALHLDSQLADIKPAMAPSPGGTSLRGRVVDWIKDTIGAPKAIAPPAPDETTAQAGLVSSFLGGLEIEPVRSTNIIEIAYDSPDPAFAASAANAVAEQYRVQNQEERFQASKDTSDWLQKELADQQKKMEASDQALQEYKETHNDAVSLDAGQNMVVQRLSDLTSTATKAKIQLIDKEALYHQVMDAQARGDEAMLESLPAIAGNDFVQKLKQQIVDLNGKKSSLSQRYGPNMPEMVQVDGEIKTAQARLAQEVQSAVEGVVNDYQTAKQTAQEMSQELDAQKAETLSLNRKGLDYANLQHESQSNHLLYDNLLQHAKETGVTGDYKGSNIQILDHADVPRSPILPQTSHDLFVAAMEGLALAFGLVFGLEYLDNRIRTPDEIKQHLGLTFLGLVPEVPEVKPDEEQILVLNRRMPPSFGEAMRAIRTSIMFSSADEGARSVVVTSTAPSEGKTVVSSNLAASLAQASQRTLIIDADMRRPRVHDVFGRGQEPGLSHVLVGTAEMHEAIRPTSVPNLFVLPAGHLPPNPVELLASTRYRELMGDLRHQFDWIVIDAPPVLAVTDAAVVANQATGVVFVIGCEMTTRRNAAAAIEQLSAAKAHFIGAVLNRVDLENHAYYYSPYYRKDYTRVYERAR